MRHVILLVLAGLVTVPPVVDEPEPVSCVQYRAKQRQCQFDGCDVAALERLRKECLRDGGPHVR